MVDIASVLAYQELVDSGLLHKLQHQILWLFVESGSLTGDEALALYREKYGGMIKRSENLSLRNRISELTIKKLVKKDPFKRRSKISGRLVSTWSWTGTFTPAEPDQEFTCPHCKGKGTITRTVDHELLTQT